MKFIFAEVLRDALSQHSNPAIVNSDQGSQFTSVKFTDMLTENNMRISMDSRGRVIDNIAIE